MKPTTRFNLMLLYTMITFFVIGCLATYVWLEIDFVKKNKCVQEYEDYKRIYNGLWIPNQTEERVKEITKYKERRGDWACVNIRGMSFEKGLATCRHEVGHEIFAEIFEHNPEFAEQLIKDLDDKLNKTETYINPV